MEKSKVLIIALLLAISQSNSLMSQEIVKNATTDQNSLTSFFSNNKTVLTALGAATVFGLHLLKRYNNLHAIERWLTKTAPCLSKNKHFGMSGWRQHKNPTASSIKNDMTGELIPILSNPKQLAQTIHIFDKRNKKIKKLTIEQIKNAITTEIRSVKKDLCFLTKFTDFPTILLDKANREFGIPTSDNDTLDNKILLHCELRNENLQDLKIFENIITDVSDTLKSTFEIRNLTAIIDRYILFRPILSIPSQDENDLKQESKDKEKEMETENNKINFNFSRSLNPLTWSFVSRQKATKLYHMTLNRYLRLLALKDIATLH